jgi:beta-xylosidase
MIPPSVRLGVLLFITAALGLAARAEAPLPWGDQGDGTFRNPIIAADYSDPDVIRVGDDFYLVASEFHFMGIQVLHSKDLVNWTILSRVFDRLEVDPKYDEPRAYSQGTWAPTLRHHDGLFYLYACTPRDGLLRWTAKNPAGPWTASVVKRVDQWEDPCPFWDDDGQAWLVRGRLGAGPIYLHKMSADGSQLLDDGVEIYNGPVAEGPKLFKRNGWYYISLPEGGVERGGQSVLRSRSIQGPYERRVVTPDGAPHQGGIVELESGETWFIGFKSAGALGRVPCLQPVTWVEDWPVFGDRGRPIEKGQVPRAKGHGQKTEGERRKAEGGSQTAAVGGGQSSVVSGQSSVGGGQSSVVSRPSSHPQTSDEFDGQALSPQWQWNHNPTKDAYSLTERPGWLRLRGGAAANLELARNTLTQKLWGGAGSFEVKLDAAGLAEGQRAGLAFMSGKFFSAVGIERKVGELRIYWDAVAGVADPGSRAVSGNQTPGSATPATANAIWLRGEYRGDTARLSYSLDGKAFTDTGLAVKLRFSQWKGARLALFSYGTQTGPADFEYFRFQHGTEPVPLALSTVTPIDRQALVTRHDVVVRKVDPTAPLTVGNGQFAFTVDVTGLQTFGDLYYRTGIPLETMARWCWAQDENPNGYTLKDASTDFKQHDGTTIAMPNKGGSPAGDWLRRNPRQHPLAQVALEWSDGTPVKPGDLTDIEQTLDLWTGIITSKYKLGGVPVVVTTASASRQDTLAVQIDSELVKTRKLRVRLTFPRGHDPKVKNTPALDWTQPETHESRLVDGDLTRSIERKIPGATYYVTPSLAPQPAGPHQFLFSANPGAKTLDLMVQFSPEPPDVTLSAAVVRSDSASAWPEFWRSGAAADFSGSTNPLAKKFEERIILSRYLTAVQCVGDVPPQESGLTCNTWYGKHHTEMIWWHAAHFVLWGRPDLAKTNLDWFLGQMPNAQALAASRGLKGARWAKMVGPDGRESPGGNPFIWWNQPHPIYLADLILRQSPSQENLEKYRELVFATADAMATMAKFDPKRGQYVLGPPLWIAQEIHDQATSQNPAYEIAYWRWGLETAQRWRVRSGLPREPLWDDVIAKLPPLPVFEGKYTALESHPDTWTNLASRHDHPSFLMPLGFLPGGLDVDRATMDRTLTAVFKDWDWDAKIWGWDYPMIAMTAARLGRPAEAVEVLLRDGPNNRYTPNGHCPQGSDSVRRSQSEGRPEIAVYLPANGSFLAAAALMIGGWEGATEEFPGFPKDGTWKIRAEGVMRMP